MKKLPVGLQSFRKIIEDEYVYVDKTSYIYDLINKANCYFLSRPRRFGKSLFLDTIGEAFGGDKELFKGQWIYDSDYDFIKHPVIHLDMNGIANETQEIFTESLSAELKTLIDTENMQAASGVPSDIFKNLIRNLHEKYARRVVVLVDEYDKPILDHLDNTDTAEAIRRTLRGFYGVLKTLDKHLRFVFFTGVSKFTKTSVFSGLNNLMDITMDKDYAGICGISVEELDRYFSGHIAALSASGLFDLSNDAHNRGGAVDNANSKDSCNTSDYNVNKRNGSGRSGFNDYDALRAKILEWYDGYTWDGKTRVINPFSLLNFFQQKRFYSFWYASGSPHFLIEMMKKNPNLYTNIKNLEITELMLDSIAIDNMSPEPLLFQTGYLTVKDIEPSIFTDAYILRFPNYEVRQAFNLNVISALTESGNVYAERAQNEIRRALQDCDLLKMLNLLRGLFASIPYELHIDREAYYHSIFYAVMSVLGFNMEAEVSVSKGRIDAVLEHGASVYVMEFKYADCKPGTGDDEKRVIFDNVLEEGLSQIKKRGYHKKYAGTGKIVYRVAFAFLGRDEIEMKYEVVN